MRYFFAGIMVTCILQLVACSETTTYAPVTEIGAIDPIPTTGQHRVAAGETLYEIAWRYGLDYRYLALRNQISPPYAIHPGEVIYLRDKGQMPNVLTKPAAPVLEPVVPVDHNPPATPQAQVEAEPNYSNRAWSWPAKGVILKPFSVSNRGIDIGGEEGEPIRAAAAGKVVYAGSGLRGYGNLIIVKHNSLYLSAYAHNRTLLVKEGEWIKQGQKIGEMGHTGSDKTMLHFEIRRAGKPINPLSLYRKKQG